MARRDHRPRHRRRPEVAGVETEAPDVAVVRWPDDRAEIRRLARDQMPRLLLVGPEAPAPVVVDPLEDWVREPCEPRDLAARLAGLRRKAATLRASPRVDEEGRLHFSGRWVQLSPIDGRLAEVLVERFDRGVSQATLAASGWPEREVSAAALRAHLDRLRRQLHPLGLELRKLRGRGWILHRATRAGAPPGADDPEAADDPAPGVGGVPDGDDAA